jgi:acyl carrier protein
MLREGMFPHKLLFLSGRQHTWVGDCAYLSDVIRKHCLSGAIINETDIREANMNANLASKARSVIAGHLGVAIDRLSDEARLDDDLGADWLDRLELMIVLEDQIGKFEISETVAERIETVGDLMRAMEDATRASEPSRPS